MRAPEAERQAAFDLCAAYWDRGTHVHREGPWPSTDCGCPADYLAACEVWSRTTCHQDFNDSGYHHGQDDDGMWWPIFDDD